MVSVVRFWLAAVVLLAGLSGDAGGAGAGPGMIRGLTWNVLAPSPTEQLLGMLTETSSTERARRLLREAKELDPDILAFQEVSAGFMAVLAEDPGWLAYHASAEGPEAPPGGLLLLVRYLVKKVAYRRLPGALGRYALFVTLDLDGEPLVVANVHLESLLTDHAVRMAQLEFVDTRLPKGGLTVWMGDFNFGDQDLEAARLTGWTDAWAWLRPGEAGHSYDLDANPLAREQAFPAEGSRRLDRILSSARLVPVAVGLAGRGGGPFGPASDHFGLWADLSKSPGGVSASPPG